MEAASFSIGAILRWLDGGLILCFFVALRLFMGISGGTVSQTDLQAQRQKVEAQSAQAQRVAYSADIQTWPSKQSVVRILSCYQVTFFGDRKTSWNVSIWHNPIQPLNGCSMQLYVLRVTAHFCIKERMDIQSLHGRSLTFLSKRMHMHFQITRIHTCTPTYVELLIHIWYM